MSPEPDSPSCQPTGVHWPPQRLLESPCALRFVPTANATPDRLGPSRPPSTARGDQNGKHSGHGKGAPNGE